MTFFFADTMVRVVLVFAEMNEKAPVTLSNVQLQMQQIGSL